MLVANANDPYLTAAAFSSVSKESVGDVLAATLAASDNASSAVRDRLLAMSAAMGQDAAVGKAVAAILRQNGNDAARCGAP